MTYYFLFFFGLLESYRLLSVYRSKDIHTVTKGIFATAGDIDSTSLVSASLQWSAFNFRGCFEDFVVSGHSMNYSLLELHHSDLLTPREADSTTLAYSKICYLSNHLKYEAK